MLGEKELLKLFPEYSDTIQPSGIDLRMDKIYRQVGSGSLIDNEKNLPEIEELESVDDIYTLEPKTAYSVTIEGKIEIPTGYTMLYLPRSTLLRSFISVHTAVGDPGFYGTLQFMIVNNGQYPYKIKKGERIAQAVVFPVEGSGKYNGSYQEK
ncbi:MULTISPECIES: dCTP deaminase [Methanosphaera]|uniref:Predicted deoxycytidine triphosphate deaminase n=2 Tax=Methanosphaera stadtmanae TaxID=2317 RepID=Q2NGQ1_METST|nr:MULTISPECIES: deoxyuridine 5'-triphosphate nucleotidohydrolase [Methanosphaera]ABC57002.1 predicted deoxycytidine triphosphate deaminase [Methanosphaera stadtmanae DSM 3091]MEE0489933.1 deoxyuridine 5'-triphosphate nucleotidohydrolase [Methanosphaera stadtmanae]RAP03284.1 deoxyuridine 5'-triphosphate nucleotidohydrolase [Methanosphaera stadtmanae]RAP47857.1 MAG: deoxyuridine 5'-triphosphate nucleotidohydrolase [Methanosphaera sp. DEW79]